MQLVELKSGETYNGHMVQCDSWMNVHLREVICTSKVSSAVQCSKGAHMEARARVLLYRMVTDFGTCQKHISEGTPSSI